MYKSSPYLTGRMALIWHGVAPKSFRNSVYRNKNACPQFAIILLVTSAKYKRIKNAWYDIR